MKKVAILQSNYIPWMRRRGLSLLLSTPMHTNQKRLRTILQGT